MDVMYQIVNNIEQRDYIRMYPFRYQDFVNEIETLKKQATPSRLQKFEQQLNFAQLMLKMFSSK